MPIVLKEFQSTVCAGLVARWRNVRGLYRQLEAGDAAMRTQVRRAEAAIVLQAPTGSGKTALAIEALALFSQGEPGIEGERVLWFWFAPFAGLVEQARIALRAQAPSLRVLDLDSDRSLSGIVSGGVFVTTWGSVAASNADARRARVRGDAGLSVDDLVAIAREQGMRIGCVVDESHHGFQRAAQAKAFFRDVLAPDYALLMTATPRDADVAPFQRDTGYALGDEPDWASVARVDAVNAGLLKYGVRVVRFLAKDEDTKQLIDFEQLALRECAQVHRRIQTLLGDAKVNLTPLMLVQVPDGKLAQEAARRYLVDEMGFAEEAVRLHTADEPDPDLIALASDPIVEVLIFKMAVALGFDAPRAFTLAALRGARDPSFGVQVIGRIVRVHSLLQGRTDLPSALDFGYVFLANAESQEGLLDAGAQINRLRTQAPEIGTSTVITYSGSTRAVQMVEPGAPLSLLVDAQGVHTAGIDAGEGQLASTETADWSSWQGAAQVALALGGGMSAAAQFGVAPAPGSESLGLMLTTQSAPMHRYVRRDRVPATLRTERLPPAPSDIELRLVDFVDFSAVVLGSRDKVRAQVHRREGDVFDDSHLAEDDTDIWANLSAPALAGKAQQVIERLADVNSREIRLRLIERFRKAIEQSGAVPPVDEEALDQQLDLVLVRNPRLLREAYRALRLQQVADLDAPLPPALQSEVPLERAQRNAYGVFPAGMNEDERRVAEMLDTHEKVLWWHRNPSSFQRADAVGLYRWDEGAGFYADFIVAISGRETPDNIALLEVKGGHLWGEPSEVDKSDALHPGYGRVYFVGRKRGERDFHFLRKHLGRLIEEGSFEIQRMAWA